MLKIGWIELVYAYLMGAPVKIGKDGRTIKRPSLRLYVQKVFEHTLWGIDISKWQGLVDWLKIKKAGIKFLILRASYGIYVDEKWHYNMSKAVEIFTGWLIGVYHYYDPRFSPKYQTDVLLKAIAPYRRYISRIWIDLEFTWGGAYEDPKYWHEFGEILRNNGYLIGTYTRKTWWDPRVAGWTWYFAMFPWWVAQYSSILDYIPKGAQLVSIWQNGTFLTSNYFDSGTMDDSKEFDHNLANTADFINAEFRTVSEPEPPPIGDNMEVEYECVSPVSIRTATNLLETSRVGALSVGERIVVREPDGLISTPDGPVLNWLQYYKAISATPLYVSANQKYMKRIDPEPPVVPAVKAFHFEGDFLEDGTVKGTWSPLS